MKVGDKLEHVRSGQVFTVRRVRADYVDLVNDDTGIAGPVKKLFADVNMRAYVPASPSRQFRSWAKASIDNDRDRSCEPTLEDPASKLLFEALMVLERIASAGPGNTVDQCVQIAVHSLGVLRRQVASCGIEGFQPND